MADELILYNSAYTGPQIDEAVGAVRENKAAWSGKQDKIEGTAGQVVGFDAAGKPVAEARGGVTSFNGRSGAVVPAKGDYTADMVGALPSTTSIPTALADLTGDATHRVVTDAEKTAWNSKADKPVVRTVTLRASDWSNKSQTVTVSGVLASGQAVDVVPADKAGSDAWAEGGVWCTTQAANSLTFTCETVPTEDISLNIKLQGVLE